VKSASGILDAGAESARAPKPTRKTVQAPSTSTKANREAASNRGAANGPAARARQRPNVEPKAAETPHGGRTRAAKWIGVKARQAARS
jgi:hypothetical protein